MKNQYVMDYTIHSRIMGLWRIILIKWVSQCDLGLQQKKKKDIVMVLDGL
jgi:hypothetical protein